MIALNEQQIAAIKTDRNRCLISCPGSGKTRTIIAKLLRCIDDVRGTPRKVACITYTRAAEFEIESRLRTEGEAGDQRYTKISTIHSFCMRAILRPFGARFPEFKLDREILPPDSISYQELVTNVIDDFGLSKKARQDFNNMRFTAEGNLVVSDRLTQEAGEEFLARLRGRNYLIFPEILYLSLKIITAVNYVPHALSSRFAWLLVDEFQDTTALQVEIIKQIMRPGRTSLFIVGDPNQSIYGFAGARPDLITELADDVRADQDITLYGNYRCSKNIVGVAEGICESDPPMKAVGDTADDSHSPIHHHVSSPFEGVTTYFLPALEDAGIPLARASILASSWYPLYDLGVELRCSGVPVIGAGSRPYNRSGPFARFLEVICGYLVAPDSASAVKASRSFVELLEAVTSASRARIDGPEGHLTLVKILRRLGRLNRNEAPAVNWLRSAVSVIVEILVDEAWMTEEQASYLYSSCADMVRQIEEKAHGLGVEELGILVTETNCLRLQTIHRAKGQEFDAVAVIDLHEGKIPFYRAETENELAEERRKLYVACTRARRILMLFTDSTREFNRPSSFLAEIGGLRR